MARLPEVSTLSRDTMPEAPEWLDKLLRPLNLFLGPVRAALAGNLTVRDNLNQEWKDVPVTGGTLPSAFSLEKLRGQPYGLSLEGCALVSGSAPSGAVTVLWQPTTVSVSSGGQKPAVRLTAITGLVSGSKYTLRLLVKAE